MAKKRRPRHKRQKSVSASQRRNGPSRRVAPPRSRDERVLRKRIMKFTYQERFKADFESAIHLYFGEGTFQDGVLTIDEDQIPAFQEWYIHDYVTSEGECIVDLFAHEIGPRLPFAQRQMLEDWRRTNRYRLFEVQAVEPGVGETVRDLLSGEVLEVNDISSSYALMKWQVFLARPLLTEGRLSFAGSGVPLPPMVKSELLDFARGLWEEYQAQHPQALLDEFYRDHGLTLYHRAQEIAITPPPVYTPEGHPVMACTASYAVMGPWEVEERLDCAEEFQFAGPDADDPTALHYNWLLQGRSHVPETPLEGRGLILKTDVTTGPGKPSYRSLGDVQLWHDRLKLSCLSRERLKAGKVLLKQVLGGLVRHVDDECQELDISSASDEPYATGYEEGIPTEVEEALVREMIATQYAEWLDSPIPALNGKSPREAAHDPAMREQLEELLKGFEYMEEQRRQAGEPYIIDVADVRRELGLPPR